MKKVIKVLPILLATPLMMANSPAPAPISENYTNLNMSLTYQGIDDKDGRYDKYAYLINITNNGDQYVAPYYTIYFYEEGARYNSHWLAIDNYQQVFSYESIAPGQTATFIGHTSETIDTSKEFVCQMEYFLIEEKMNFSNYEIKKYRNQKNTYILKTDVAKPSSYYCCVFVDVTYKGEPHTLCIQNFTRNDRTFTTNEELDLDQLTINKITAYRSSYNAYSNFYVDSTTVIEYISIGFVIASIGAAIVIPIAVTTAARKRRNKQEVH